MKNAHTAINAHDLPSDMKTDVLNNLGKLTTELQASAPRKNVVQYLWSGIVSAAGVLQPVIDLGLLLVGLYGITSSHA